MIQDVEKHLSGCAFFFKINSLFKAVVTGGSRLEKRMSIATENPKEVELSLGRLDRVGPST